MRHNTPVTTMAAALALALALLMVVLLPSDSVVHAVDPTFVSGTGPWTIPENTPPGVNIGNPVSATDPDETGAGAIEYGNTLTYSLSGDDAASFDIDASTGQLITKAPLDAETETSYSVTVTVDDGETRTTPVTQAVTITVTNVVEAPGAPAAPTVVSGPDVENTNVNESATTLRVIWNPPAETGDGSLTYVVEYKKVTEPTFGSANAAITGTSAAITVLEADTSYHVRVRAISGSENGPWSRSSVGSTNKEDNIPPSFNEPSVSRTMLETADAGLVVGSPVSATDTDNVLPLTYRLQGPDADLFDFRASSGQILTKRGVVYDHERNGTLNVTVTVSDGQGGSDARAVTITVNDVFEAPETPARPTVRATANNSRSLDVSWTEPENMGPAITGYDVRYRQGSSGAFRTVSTTGTGTTTTIAPESDGDPANGDERLTPGDSYEVSVRAKTEEIDSQWSAPGTGRTGPANSEPIFSDRRGTTRKTDFTTPRSVAENTQPGQRVGSAVSAVDGNGDNRTYRLVTADDGAHVALFDINESSGQILTKGSLNFEGAPDCETGDASIDNCYKVNVEVWDGLDEHGNEQVTTSLDDGDDTNDGTITDDTITVRIMVTDQAEPPAAPTVTVTSPSVAVTADTATLVVTWGEPENMGPAITGYRVECSGYQVPDDTCPQDIAADTTTHTIEGLTPGRPYNVRVVAINPEGERSSAQVGQSTSKAGNNSPTLTVPGTLSVQENASSARTPVGNPVTSSEADSETVTYRLEGSHTNLFDIDSRTGQIRTKTTLNYEDPECNPDGTSCSYSVIVKASDPSGGSVAEPGTITVTDALEPPSAPVPPTVTATTGSGWSLKVTWREPANKGPDITDYDIQYREYKATEPVDAWQAWTHETNGAGNTNRSATITTIDDPAVHLTPGTQYEVQVRAKNGEEDTTENWSPSGRGRTNPSNTRPDFVDDNALVTREVDENTRSGQNIGNAVEATDADRNSLRYSLEGPNKNLFSIVSGGQIRTRAALDYETQNSYSLTVKVDDGSRKANSFAVKSVTINLRNVKEPPSTPGAPTVAGIPGSTSSVRVTWDEPANTGPPITTYNVRYAPSGQPDAINVVMVPIGNADRSAVITGLTAGTRYNVTVRAWNDEGHSDYSRPGTGSPNPDVENRNPTFPSRALTFSVAENTAPGTDVGSVIAATDPDGDVLNYMLEGPDAGSFEIVATSGGAQIRTSAALNFEEKARYSVAVRVRDGRGGTDAVNVTINVTDVNTEAPDTPFAPTVTALSSTSIQASWDAPENTGPPITDYDYRYRAVADANWTEVTNTTITETTVTIDGLTPSTSYDVEVLAKNAEGASDWSNPGNGATNAPGANNPPVFTDGTTATRSVSATSPAGTNIGDPIAATDADAGDMITYSHEGRDAPSFDIDSTNGQLSTKSGITLIVGTTYTVTVVADDTKDTTRITVSIEATAAPPNNPPVFSEAPSTTRTVRDDATAGRNVGSPVTATDADTGDTITYSLEGTDAASFGIVASSGQIQTLDALDASTKSTYSVTVKATDSNGGSATIAVTITVTAAPVSYGCATNGAVDASNTGLVADCEALMASRNLLEGNSERLNWSPATPINQWEGVSLRGSPARVTFLVLSSKSLDGTIPADLGRLPMLRWLNLRSNNLSGSIPSELNNLTRLERLLLHNNRLSGPIPNLSSLRSLKMLWLSGSQMNLSGNLPSWLNSMSSLEQLSLWGNDLSGPIPRLTGMTSLSLLKLQSNNFSGGVPAWFGDMNGPSILYLHDNELTGSIPANLGRNTGVARLWLDRNNLSGTIPPALSGMTSLRTLNLRDNQLTGSIPPQLGTLSRLLQLRLHNNQLTGIIPAELGHLSELRQLAVSNNRLTGTIPSELGDLGKLGLLWLSDNQLTGTIPSELGDLGDTLGNIRLAGNNFDSAACVPSGLANVAENDYSEAGLSICP
ncbi:MAG: fibronectin type III domain-containing protein [Chloroflexota bacterium]|nr:fibronectin type III domain-containing protein [Chloroflexota bacterium]